MNKKNRIIIFLIILIFLLNCDNDSRINYLYVGEGNIIKVLHHNRSFTKNARTTMYTKQGGIFNVFGIVNVPNTNYLYIYEGKYGFCEILSNKITIGDIK